MGLTTQSTGPGVLLQKLAVQTDSPDDLSLPGRESEHRQEYSF